MPNTILKKIVGVSSGIVTLRNFAQAPAVFPSFFRTDPARKTFPNYQHFDFASLQGRLLSSSYAPEAGQPRHGEMLAALRDLFDGHQQAGRVTFEYDTVIFYGRLH